MDAAAAQLATNNATAALDEESGQNYAEWSVSNKLYKVWLEDNTSLRTGSSSSTTISSPVQHSGSSALKIHLSGYCYQISELIA